VDAGKESAVEELTQGRESPAVDAPERPWDAKLARLLILPLRHTRVHPNHITTCGLLVGVAAAVCFGWGAPWSNLGALLFVAATVLDHADGELARLTGKTSAFGHTYDRLVDLCIKISLFSGMGFGLRRSWLGEWSIALGLCAGTALIAIFLLRGEIARRRGLNGLDQPAFGGFELEDILYLVAPVTWLGFLLPFVVAAGIGAPLFALWMARQYMAVRGVPLSRSSECPS
jgi:archaetidylinositol phosphate synthase